MISRKELLKNRDELKEISFKVLFGTAAVLCIVAVLLIVVFLFVSGTPAIKKIGFKDFVFGKHWAPSVDDGYATKELDGIYGISSMIVGSIYATLFSILIGGSLGIFTAIFVSCYAPKRLKNILKQVINLLAGVPSIVFGFFGFLFVGPLFRPIFKIESGSGLLLTGVILGLMLLPTVASVSISSLDAIPKSIYSAARALGGTHSEAVFYAVVPAARSGIIASIILGLGRALGETMAVVMIAGNAAFIPKGLFESFSTLTSRMVLEMGYAGELQKGALIAIGCLLFVLTVLVNLLFRAVVSKGNQGQKRQKQQKYYKYKSFKSKKQRDTKKVSGKILYMFDQIIEFTLRNTRKMFIGLSIFSTRLLGTITGSFKLMFSNKSKDKNDKKSNLFVGIKNLHIYIKGSIRKINGYVLPVLAYVGAIITTISLITIITFITVKGVPHLSSAFLFGEYSISGEPVIGPSMVATVMLILLTMVIAIPFGVATAIFLNEYMAQGSRLVKYIRLAIEILNGVPSIVYGLFGYMFFVQKLKFGKSIFSGALTMTIMVIPVIVRTTEEALMSVPDGFRQGSYALGTGKVRTIFKIVLPAALPGILAALILAIGRVFSESGPLLFTMGASMKGMPESFFDSGSTLAVAMYFLSGEGFYIKEAYATAVLLLSIALILNILSSFVFSKYQEKLTGKTKNKKHRLRALFKKNKKEKVS